MTSTPLRLSVLGLAPLLLIGAAAMDDRAADQASPRADATNAPVHLEAENELRVQYLEIVTPEVTATCDALARAHGVEFGDPIPEFGNARTAKLGDGGLLAVRAPLRKTEEPVVRPYLLVDDIEAAVNAAEEAGAQVAMRPTELPGGRGTFSIYILGGIEHGLWQD